MITPPCYDAKNHQDCPNRSWCKEVGRSQCQKWVEYEEANKKAREQRHHESEQRYAAIENSIRIKKRISRKNRY